MKEYFDVVMIGPCGRLNLASCVSREAAMELQSEAKLAASYLNDEVQSGGGREGFDAIFTTQVQFWQRFDQCLLVRAPADDVSGLGASEEDAMCDLSWSAHLRSQMASIVSRGLIKTGRATLARVFVLHGSSKKMHCSWRCTASSAAKKLKPEYILVGLHLSPDRAFSVVDKGPSAENKAECASFRAFWGSKAELRRFKQGGIVEAVVWNTPGKVITDDVPCRILSHLVSIHAPFNRSGAAAKLIGEHLQPIIDFDLGRDYVRMTRSAVEAFDDLSRRLFSLSGMPLSVMSVEAADSRLRYASVEPIAQHPLCFAAGDTSRSDWTQKKTMHQCSCRQ